MSSAASLIHMEREIAEITRQIIELQERREQLLKSSYATTHPDDFPSGYGPYGPRIKSPLEQRQERLRELPLGYHVEPGFGPDGQLEEASIVKDRPERDDHAES